MVIRLYALELEVDKIVGIKRAFLLYLLHGGLAKLLEVDVGTETSGA